MDYIFLSQIIPFVATAIAFAYGVHCLCRRGVALYFQLLVYGIGCFMLSKLFCVLCLLTMGQMPTPFNVGYLGYMGCFAFFFSANYGQLDTIIDDGGEELKKARQIGVIGPVIMLLLLVIINLHPNMIQMDKWVLTIVYIPALLGSYYNLKHYVAPDFDFEFLKAIRPCNIPILLIYLFGLGRVYFEIMGLYYVALACSVLLSLSYLVLVYFAERGHKQWRI